jgi:hypothetical protein
MLVTSLAGDGRNYTFLLKPQATGQRPQHDYTTAQGQSQHQGPVKVTFLLAEWSIP